MGHDWITEARQILANGPGSLSDRISAVSAQLHLMDPESRDAVHALLVKYTAQHARDDGK
jgi:hypothetical protein